MADETKYNISLHEYINLMLGLIWYQNPKYQPQWATYPTYTAIREKWWHNFQTGQPAMLWIIIANNHSRDIKFDKIKNPPLKNFLMFW